MIPAASAKELSEKSINPLRVQEDAVRAELKKLGYYNSTMNGRWSYTWR